MESSVLDAHQYLGRLTGKPARGVKKGMWLQKNIATRGGGVSLSSLSLSQSLPVCVSFNPQRLCVSQAPLPSKEMANCPTIANPLNYANIERRDRILNAMPAAIRQEMMTSVNYSYPLPEARHPTWSFCGATPLPLQIRSPSSGQVVCYVLTGYDYQEAAMGSGMVHRVYLPGAFDVLISVEKSAAPVLFANGLPAETIGLVCRAITVTAEDPDAAEDTYEPVNEEDADEDEDEDAERILVPGGIVPEVGQDDAILCMGPDYEEWYECHDYDPDAPAEEDDVEMEDEEDEEDEEDKVCAK